MRSITIGAAIVTLAAATPLAFGAEAQPARDDAGRATADRVARRIVEFRGRTMGVTFSVKVVVGAEGLEGAAYDAVALALRARLDRIDRLLSTWDAGSELSRFNRSPSLEPFPVSRETFEVVQWSLKLARLTGGALDITVAPLVDAWGFGPGGAPERQPTDDEIARLREATGIDRIVLEPAGRAIRKTRAGVRCDVSALAPGYGVDQIWAELASRGFSDFLVDVGGELRARGRNEEGRAWVIAIDRPELHGDAVQRLVPLSDRAIATSGDYRRYREVNGRRLTHIVDPRTGRPVDHRLASVTVIDDLAVRADALATGLTVLGTAEGMALAERLQLAALFIERSDTGFSEHATSRFRALASEDAR